MSSEFATFVPKNIPSDKIIFATVNPGADVKYTEDSITYYPSEELLRTERLGKKNILWLDELPDNKCKKCNGNGKLGSVVNKYPLDKIEALLRKYLEDTPDKIPTELIIMINLPEGFIEVIAYLVNIMKEDLKPDNLEAVVTKYGKIIQDDYPLRSVMWCKCFLQNYDKKVEEIIRNIKYGV